MICDAGLMGATPDTLMTYASSSLRLGKMSLVHQEVPMDAMSQFHLESADDALM